MKNFVDIPRTTWKGAVALGIVDSAMAAVREAICHEKYTEVADDVMRHYSALVKAMEVTGTPPAVAVVSAAMLICYYADKILEKEDATCQQKCILQ